MTHQTYRIWVELVEAAYPRVRRITKSTINRSEQIRTELSLRGEIFGASECDLTELICDLSEV